MGLLLQSYSLKELIRISTPGTITPSLFWVVPIGKWKEYQINEWWEYFVNDNNKCASFGLLLVDGLLSPSQRTVGSSNAGRVDVNLERILAKLPNIMPSGTDRFGNSSVWKDETPRLFVLSGAYPQPGWGVLCDITLNEPSAFDSIVANAIDGLQSSMQTYIDTIEIAIRKYRQFKKINQNEPQKPSKYEDNQKVVATLDRVRTILLDAQNALNEKRCKDLGQSLVDVVAVIKKQSLICCSDDVLKRVALIREVLPSAFYILDVSIEELQSVYNKNINDLLSDPLCHKRLYGAITSNKMKRALAACVFLRTKNILGPEETPSNCAQKLFDSLSLDIGQDLISLRNAVESTIITISGNQKLKIDCYNRDHSCWKSKVSTLREEYHRALNDATTSQWNLGPHFLVEFENQCRTINIKVCSVPWDPPRMVGWKLCANKVAITLSDLQENAYSCIPNTNMDLNENGQTPIDGSYFTDYVHFIAMSQSGTTPWEVTRNMIGNLLKKSEMQPLLYQPFNQQGTRMELAGALLHQWGWQQNEELLETPLANCIRKDENGNVVLFPKIPENFMRKVMESYCKDLLNILAAQLGYSETQIWEVIMERLPNYKSLTHGKDWQLEVDKINFGAACILIGGLSELAFPGQKPVIDRLMETFQIISAPLNTVSHHNTKRSKECNLAVCISTILECTRSLIGEMPWHMKPDHEYGEQPRVVTGQAWSHGCPTPRLIRVIMWTGHKSQREILVWNKLGRNPVITDPVFLRQK